jgi:hypothetical protein
MATAIMRDRRRPSLSPKGAARRDPKNVPALKMETICEDCAGDTLSWCVTWSTYPVENCLRKAFMAKIPEMVLNRTDHQSLVSIVLAGRRRLDSTHPVS